VTEKSRITWRNHAPVSVLSQKIAHQLAWDRNWTVRDQLLITAG